MARHIKVLSSLAWPAHVCQEFLASWDKGQPKLPQTEYPVYDYKDLRSDLQRLMQSCSSDHPIGHYLLQTASSYLVAARMLENIGTPAFSELSQALYGNPSDHLGKLSNLELAEDIIKITADFAGAVDYEKDEEEIFFSPQDVADRLQLEAQRFFQHHTINVVIDKHLAAKAAAGAERVRIRGSTSFTAAEINQLLQHELFVHSATMLNGRSQPYLKSLGLGSPRTTSTQEGLATFAELITATMDLNRLRRIALRIKAIDLGLSGGDFVDVFRFFLNAGQSHKESFQSTARIFRGGVVSGQYVFTKDVVYLQGLFSVHTFMRKAIESRKINFPVWLFIGRLALGDIIAFEPYIQSGFITPPAYLPPWVANRDGLAAYLSYTLFTNRLNLADVKLEDFVSKLPEDVAAEKDVTELV